MCEKGGRESRVPVRMSAASTLLTICVCISCAFACILTCNYSLCLLLHMYICKVLCLSLHFVMTQYRTRVMMCKEIICHHSLLPGGSQPLALDAPLHTLACVYVYMCECFKPIWLASAHSSIHCRPSAVFYFCFNDL